MKLSNCKDNYPMVSFKLLLGNQRGADRSSPIQSVWLDGVAQEPDRKCYDPKLGEMKWDHNTFFSALIAFPKNDPPGFLSAGFFAVLLNDVYCVLFAITTQ